MARNFRQLRKFFLPYWALDDEADGALVWTLSALIDVSIARLQSGVEQRFPSRAGEAALALSGLDRLIPRGREETSEHYAARLVAWRYPRGHRVRGSVFALLEQVSEYFGGLACYGIDYSGNKRSRALDGTESYEYGVSWTWDTGPSTSWARQWLVLDGSLLFAPQQLLGTPEVWGGALGTPGHCIGIAGSSAEDWRAIKRLVRGQHRWLPAGVQGEWIVVTFDGSDPTPAEGATWAKWGKMSGTSYIPARDTDMRYVALRDSLGDYAGDLDWANQAVTILGTFDGDDSDYPSTITMPDGSSYAGDPTDFPATITLPDDGDLPL